MLIRYGYDIAVTCPQDTPMITMMSVRAERRRGSAAANWRRDHAPVQPRSIVDLFGNTCRRFVAPAGRVHPSQRQHDRGGGYRPIR